MRVVVVPEPPFAPAPYRAVPIPLMFRVPRALRITGDAASAPLGELTRFVRVDAARFYLRTATIKIGMVIACAVIANLIAFNDTVTT